MGSGGGRAGQQLQQAGQRLFDVAFKVAYDNEKQKGQEEASLAAISARDPNTGKLIFPEIPKSLSAVAQKYYEPKVSSTSDPPIPDPTTLPLIPEDKQSEYVGPANDQGESESS